MCKSEAIESEYAMVSSFLYTIVYSLYLIDVGQRDKVYQFNNFMDIY